MSLLGLRDPNIETTIRLAGFPQPFGDHLEYNAMVHETWNIVHIGMLIPQSHQIYVCGKNCMRGVVMTAAEMDALDRFHSVVLDPKDIIDGDLEQCTIQGVCDVIDKLDAHPAVMIVFLVCVHHFLGARSKVIFEQLQNRYPDIRFVNGWMDPIMQKQGLTPDQKLRMATLDLLADDPIEPKQVNILTENLPTSEDCELITWLKRHQIEVCEPTRTESFSQFCRLGKGALSLILTPTGLPAIQKYARRVQRPYLYLPFVWDYDRLQKSMDTLCGMISVPTMKLSVEECENRWKQVKEVIGDAPIEVDYLAYTHVLSLTRFLIEHGFHVQRVYVDRMNTEEKEDFIWLQKHAEDLIVSSTVQPGMRLAAKEKPDVLAIGPKAAYFNRTKHFVNCIDNGGTWGVSGMIHLADLLEEAFINEKDTKDLVVRKGLGCVSCI